jgi:hypothetical protein
MGPDCVPDEIPFLASGYRHLLRILPDVERGIERATLEICLCARFRDSRTRWMIVDARTKHHEPTSEATENAINDFLDRAQQDRTETDCPW